MKYIVKIELQKNIIKLDYRRTFISFFKKAISSYMEGVFFDEIYNSGAKKKALVWSIRFKLPVFKGNVIELSDNNIELTLKISDNQTAVIYYSALLGMKNKEFKISPDNIMILKSIHLVREIEIENDIAVFKVLSPICIRQHNKELNKDWYINVEDESFPMEINRILKEELPYKEKQVDELMYNFDRMKMVLVQAFNLKIPASIGEFTLKGDREILNHILKSGLGSRRNSGFGLVELKIN